MGEIEGENNSGRRWPRAVNMFKNGLTAYKSACRIELE